MRCEVTAGVSNISTLMPTERLGTLGPYSPSRQLAFDPPQAAQIVGPILVPVPVVYPGPHPPRQPVQQKADLDDDDADERQPRVIRDPARARRPETERNVERHPQRR